jgi:hypothetical protein
MDEYIDSSIDDKIMNTIDSDDECAPDDNYCEELKKRKITKHESTQECKHDIHKNACDNNSVKQCINDKNNINCDAHKNYVHHNAHENNLHCNNNDGELQNITIKRQQLKNNKKIKREDNLQKMLNHIETTCKIYELIHIMSAELSNDLAEQINKYNIIGTSGTMKITDIEYCNRICGIYYQRILMLLDKNTSTANEYNVLINDDKYVELCSIDNITITQCDDKIYLRTGKTSTYYIQIFVPCHDINYSCAIVTLKHNIKQLENIVEVILTIQQIAEKSVNSFLKLVECDILNI